MFSFFALVVCAFLIAGSIVGTIVLVRRMSRRFSYRRQVRANMHLAVSRLAPAGRHAVGL
jgi:hypothetical protein